MPVYMVQMGEGGPVKIGFAAKHVLRRVGGLQNGNPERLLIRRLLDAPASLETELHTRYRHLWIRGEWFSFSEDMLTADFGYADLPIPDQKPGKGFDLALIQRAGVMAQQLRMKAEREEAARRFGSAA